MSARREIWEVARREFLDRWRSRAARVSFAILLVLVVGGAAAMTLSDRTPTDDFGLVGARAAALEPALRLAGRAEDRATRIHRLRDRAAAERAVRDGDVDVAIVNGRLVVKDDRSRPAVGVAQLAMAGPITVTPTEVLEPGARDRERDEGMLWVGMLLLFSALVVYGQAVASSVAEEKSSRVIELLLTTLPPRRLLAGKVLGVGGLGVLQLAVLCVAGLAATEVAGGEGLPPSAPETIALVVGWFVLGFAFYAVTYAALGALVSRQEDLEATTAPVNLLLIAAYLGANAAIANPDGTWAQIAAFLPPLAPMVVPTRVVLGDMGAVGLVAAVAVEVLATVALIRVAAGIYERSILRIGAPISLRSALGVARGRVRVPDPVLQGAAVAALLGAVIAGLDTPLGIALIAGGLLLVVAHRQRRRPPAPHG
jgi:ABC-2 type transport system permease protein